MVVLVCFLLRDLNARLDVAENGAGGENQIEKDGGVEAAN